jgi:hypothetical protein
MPRSCVYQFRHARVEQNIGQHGRVTTALHRSRARPWRCRKSDKDVGRRHDGNQLAPGALGTQPAAHSPQPPVLGRLPRA